MSEPGLRCPDAETLELLAAGVSETPELRTHVADCPACAAALAEIKVCASFLADHAAAFKAAIAPRAPFTPSLPGYEDMTAVSSGGQGVVYKAVQTRTRRMVAIKMLRDGTLATDRQRFRFERETELLASLHHPNIVTVYSRESTPDGRDCLVMEWIDGVPLDRFLREVLNPSLPNAKARLHAQFAMVAKVAHAIQHAHGASVIHRDLKPSNILVDSMGEPHVIDFGLARPETRTSGAAPTLAGEFAGTRAYASPEQVRGDAGGVRITTDVYSLGVILYEAITGAFPYPVEGSASEVDRHIQTTEPAHPRTLNSAVSDDAATIALSALRKDPLTRYATAGAMARDIDDYLAGRAIAARKDSVMYLIRKAARRNRWRVTFAGAAAVLLLIAGAGAFASGVYQRRAAVEQSRRISESQRGDAMAFSFHAVTPTQAALRVDDLGYRMGGFDRLTAQVNFGWFSDPAKEAVVEEVVSGVLRENHALREAEPMLRQSLTRRLLTLEPGDPQISRVSRDLAVMLLARDKPSTAMPYAARAYELDRTSFGESSPETATSLEVLARITLKMGRPEEASSLCRRSLELEGPSVDRDDLSSAQCRDTLAQCLLALRNYAEAEAESTRALTTRLALMLDESPLVQESFRHLADIIAARPGDHVLSGPLNAASPAELHDALVALAGDLDTLRNTPTTPKDAVRILHTMLGVKSAMLGARHRGLISTLASLSIECSQVGPAETEPVLRQLVAVSEVACGPKSLSHANCLEELAHFFRIEHRYDEMVPVARQSAAIWRALPTDRRDEFQVALQQFWPAFWESLYGNYDEAAEPLTFAIEVFDRSSVSETWIATFAHAAHAWNSMNVESAAAAETEARAALEQIEELGPERDPEKVQVRFLLGSILLANGKDLEAERHLLRAWNGTELTGRAGVQHLSPRNLIRQRLALDMAKLSLQRGDIEGRRRWSAEVIDFPRR